MSDSNNNIDYNYILPILKGLDVPCKIIEANILGNDFSRKYEIKSFIKKFVSSKKFKNIKGLLDNFVADGGNVQELAKGNKIYEYIKNCKIFDIDGKSLTVEQKFKIAGYDRNPMRIENALQNFKSKVEKFVADGGNLENLKKTDELYAYIHGVRIKGPDGKNLTLDERLKLIGYIRTPKRIENGLQNFKSKVEKFVADGGNLENLKKTDEFYAYIHGVRIKGPDGKNLTLEKRLKLIGYNRTPKCAKDVKRLLISEIDEYLKNGGSFHIRREELPFYERLVTYRRSLEKKDGIKRTNQEVMHNLGYKQYNDLYYILIKIEELKKYRDEEGYIDSYKKTDLRTFIKQYALSLGFPTPVFVTLVCGEKLKNSFVDTEYFSFIRNQILEHIEKFGDLRNLQKTDPHLYNQISHLRRAIFVATGEEISRGEILDFLDLDEVEHGLSNRTDQNIDISEEMNMLYLKCREKEGKLNRKDIDDITYRKILRKAMRFGITTKAIFKLYDIDYVDARKVKRLKRVSVETYPYMDQMEKRRDQLLEESGVSLENGYCKEEVFEKRIEVCKQTFDEFKKNIFNFDYDACKDLNK